MSHREEEEEKQTPLWVHLHELTRKSLPALGTWLLPQAQNLLLDSAPPNPSHLDLSWGHRSSPPTPSSHELPSPPTWSSSTPAQGWTVPSCNRAPIWSPGTSFAALTWLLPSSEKNHVPAPGRGSELDDL